MSTPAGYHSCLVSTRAGAERTLLIGFLALRCAGLVQAAVGVTMRSLTTEHRPVVVACLAGYAIESAIIIGWLFRRSRVVASPFLLIVDGATGILASAIAVHGMPAAERLMPWSAGLFATTVSTAALMGLSIRSLPGALLGSSVLAGLYLTVVAVPIWPNRVPLAAAITDALGYPALAIVLRIFVRVIRELADSADQARDRAAELERERGRAAVLEVLPYLNPELLAATDEHMRVTPDRQQKYLRLRAFVDGAAEDARPSS